MLGDKELMNCYVISGCNIGGGDNYNFVVSRLCLDCGQMQGTWPASLDLDETGDEEVSAGFWVPNYPNVREYLETYMEIHGVWEHSAEPGRVGGFPDDADVTVKGSEADVKRFMLWLSVDSKIDDLEIHGDR